MSEKIVKDLLLNMGLYNEISISVENFEELRNFLFGDFIIDTYCPECEKESTFAVYPSPKKSIGGGCNPGFSLSLTMESKNDSSDSEETNTEEAFNLYLQQQFEELVSKNKEVKKVFVCARNKNHKMIFDIIITNNTMFKFGQLPSLADLNTLGIEKYRKILKGKYIEFSKAIGLYSHGIGIGSFVYLRRIFEDLIEEAHLIAKKTQGWDELKYKDLRMDEKILELNDYLPDSLVQNRKIYGVLSKGIHELSEEECKKIFPVVKVGIEIFLDEKIKKIEGEKKQKEFVKALESVANSIK
jgi:hypothetical protein